MERPPIFVKQKYLPPNHGTVDQLLAPDIRQLKSKTVEAGFTTFELPVLYTVIQNNLAAERLFMSDVTSDLFQFGVSSTTATGHMLTIMYDELRELAVLKLRNEKSGQTLQATALVHEAYLRILGNQGQAPWNGRHHFFAAIAEAMRRILVENARRKNSLKRGGGLARQELNLELIETNQPSEEILAVSDALDRLAEKDPAKAELVKLRYFGGLTIPEVADALQVSCSTIDRQWAYARAWLHQEIISGAKSI